MIKAKVTKNIMSNGTIIANLTLRQIISAIIAMIIACITVFFLIDVIDINILLSIVFAEIIVFLGFGIVKIQGMTLFKFVILVLFKSADRRPYNRKGVFNDEC